MRSYHLLTHAHTHTNTQRCQKCTDLLSALSTAKPLSTCNYTSHMGRSIRGLEILPTAHARTHTHTNTHSCQKCTDLLSALRYACGWVPLTDKQSTTKKTLELMGHLRTVEMRRRSPKTRRNPSVSSHTVSKINQQSDVGVAEHRQVTQHMQLHEQQRKIDPRS